MSNYRFIFYDFLDYRLNIPKWWRMLQIYRFDSCNPLPIIDHLVLLIVKIAWFDKSVKHDIAIEVYYGYSSQSLAFVGQNSFTIKG